MKKIKVMKLKID